MASEKTFSIDQALVHGWENMKKHFWFLLGVIGITMVISMIFSFAMDPLKNHLSETIPAIGYYLLTIVDAIITTIIGIGIVKIYLKITDNETPEYSDLYRHTKYFWKYLATSILLALLVVAGLILLIFPGIYWGIKYRFAPFLVIDQNMGIMESFRKSNEMTTGVMWSLLAFTWASLVVIAIGCLVLLVGVIPAAWIAGLANIFIYRQLAGKSKEKEEKTEEKKEPVETPVAA